MILYWDSLVVMHSLVLCLYYHNLFIFLGGQSQGPSHTA